ncbi:MAG TPA: hypothetical protein VLT62_11455 [Candidatus Methylomirabilis sp.]|nr:hypothetical protein [Candidatus Methylomirabilis sp.]
MLTAAIVSVTGTVSSKIDEVTDSVNDVAAQVNGTTTLGRERFFRERPLGRTPDGDREMRKTIVIRRWILS